MKDIDGIDQVLRVLEPHWKQIEEDFDRHNQRFLALAAVDHDAIGRVLRAHLVVESFMDTFLSAHYGIENIEELRLSFFQKAKLLPTSGSSSAAVRPGILQVNAVRNKFGHRLNHSIERHEISAVQEMLSIARKGVRFADPVQAIEAFAPVACAFLPYRQHIFSKHLWKRFRRCARTNRMAPPNPSSRGATAGPAARAAHFPLSCVARAARVLPQRPSQFERWTARLSEDCAGSPSSF